MGASHSVEIPVLDVEPKVETEYEEKYEENYEEVDKIESIDSIFLYWWY